MSSRDDEAQAAPVGNLHEHEVKELIESISDFYGSNVFDPRAMSPLTDASAVSLPPKYDPTRV